MAFERDEAPPDRPLRGIALRCAMVMFSALMAAAIKVASARGVSTPEIVFYRHLFALPLVGGWIVLGPGIASVRTQRKGAHLTRSGIGLVAMMLSFQALTMLPLAEATTIGFTAPLFATMLSAMLLREPIGWHRWGAVVVGFIGVLVIAQPGNADLTPAGLAVALVASIAVSGVSITIRQIGATEPAATTVFWFTLIGVIASGVLMPFFAAWHDATVWLPLVAIGLLGGMVQLLLTSSLRAAPVALLAPFDYTQLMWALALSWLIWGTYPSATTLAGGVLVAASGVYTFWRERRQRIASVSPVLAE